MVLGNLPKEIGCDAGVGVRDASAYGEFLLQLVCHNYLHQQYYDDYYQHDHDRRDHHDHHDQRLKH